jgi:phage terminase large subunit
MKQRIQFPDKTQFLFEKHRYKGLYGGRGKGASWSIARALLILGARKKLRILCARETQKSLEDSVHTLLSDQIELMGLSTFYEVQLSVIRGKNGTEFVFAGLKQNINNLKSFEGVDICWIEEAATVSENSWSKLIPTIRKDGSEIWLSWNPELETDPTHIRFILSPPPNAKIVKMSWRDNPYFPEVLDVERRHLLETDPEVYQHVWEGECRSAVSGAIFGLEMKRATEDGRICLVPYDRTKPVDTVWDLGYGDKTAIWFVQNYGGFFNFIDYIEDDGETIHHYLVELQQRGYLYGVDYMPHDALDTIIHGKLAAERGRSIEGIMRENNRNVRLVPKTLVVDQINNARTTFPQCRFNQDKCHEGLRALRMYQWGEPSKSGALKREPLHDGASHGASAFMYACWSVKQPKVEPKKQSGKRLMPASAWS